nr:hypothetical protein [Cellulomonas denverensis]
MTRGRTPAGTVGAGTALAVLAAVLLAVTAIASTATTARAAEVAAADATLQGRIFNDLDTDGVLDAGESYTTLSGMRAVLTPPSGAAGDVAVTIGANGLFSASLLEAGGYTLTFYNDGNLDADLQPARGFTTTTSASHSTIGQPPFGATVWFMDVVQGVPAGPGSPGIAADQSFAVYTFEVPEDSTATFAVGVGMTAPVDITYLAGDGIAEHFGGGAATDPVGKAFRGGSPQGVPVVDASNAETGYDPATLTWTLDTAVTLTDGTAVPAGTALTAAQLAQVKAMTGLTATASLDLMQYSITYQLDGGVLDSPNRDSYTIEDTFTLTNPAKTGYLFDGWTGTDLAAPTETVTVPTGSVGDRTYQATWAARTDTPYLVEHYRLGADGTPEAIPFATESLTGTTGSVATAVAQDLTGYAPDLAAPGTVAQGVIAGDGSLILRLYYAIEAAPVEPPAAGPDPATPAPAAATPAPAEAPARSDSPAILAVTGGSPAPAGAAGAAVLAGVVLVVAARRARTTRSHP